MIGDVETDPDDEERWSSFANTGPRWRDEHDTSEHGDLMADLAATDDDEPVSERLGALDTTDRIADEAYLNFDDVELDPRQRGRRGARRGRGGRAKGHAAAGRRPARRDRRRPARHGGAHRHRPTRPATAPPSETAPTRRPGPGSAAPRPAARPRSRRRPASVVVPPTPPEPPPAAGGGGRNVPQAAAVGIALAVIALLVFKAGPAPAMVLVEIVVVLAAFEFYGAVLRGGFRPATLLGLTAVAALPLAAYWKGEAAFPLIIFLTFAVGVLWYLLGVGGKVQAHGQPRRHHGRRRVGRRARCLRRAHPRHPRPGRQHPDRRRRGRGGPRRRRLLRRPLDGPHAAQHHLARTRRSRASSAASLSALVGVFVVAVLLGVGPFSSGQALVFGLFCALVAPLGDLAESLFKRDLGLKDMGSILPQHGGDPRPLRRDALRAARSPTTSSGSSASPAEARERLPTAAPAGHPGGRSVGSDSMSATRVALAGSTGSIGTQTLDVLEAEADRFELTALGATGRNPEVLIAQARAHRPKVVAVADEAAAALVAEALPECEVRGGADAMASLATEADVVVNGVVGFAGLSVTLATLEAGRRLALANKESLIAAGPVVQRARRTPGAELVPVDSEHCAIHQCLRATDNTNRVERLLLTASGGPFRGRTADDLAGVTVDQALAHPTWSMGPKITVDSSTLMNKGLEVIEAHELFGEPAGEQATARLRPHRRGRAPAVDRALDGRVHRRHHHRPALDARHAPADRLRPGVARPHRHRRSAASTGHSSAASTSSRPTSTRSRACAWPTRPVAPAAPPRPGSAAANEVAVDAFLQNRIRWADISAVIAATLDRHDGAPATDADAVIAADAEARRVATDLLSRFDPPGAPS